MAAENKEEAMDVEEEYNLEGGIRIGDIYIPPPPLTALTLDNSGPRLVITHRMSGSSLTPENRSSVPSTRASQAS